MDFTIPSFSESSEKQNYESIKGYLVTLNNQLQHMLLNIDEENLSDSLLQTINSAFENANYAVKKIAYLDDKIAKLTQTAEKTTLLIQDNEAPASFSPIDNTVSLPYDTENTSELSQIGEPQNSTNSIPDANDTTI